MRARRFWTLAAIGMALATSAAAQAPAFPEPGARVRVRWDGARRPLIGPLKALRGDTLVALDSVSGEVIAVPLVQVRAIDVWRGRGPAVIGAAIGVVAGGLGGSLLARRLPMHDLDCDPPYELECNDLGPTSRASKTAFGALFGGVLFGAVGYYLGLAKGWRPVSHEPLRLRALGLRGGHVGVAAAVDF